MEIEVVKEIYDTSYEYPLPLGSITVKGNTVKGDRVTELVEAVKTLEEGLKKGGGKDATV